MKIIGYIDAYLRKKKIIVGSKAEGKETDGNHIKGTHSEIHIMRIEEWLSGSGIYVNMPTATASTSCTREENSDSEVSKVKMEITNITIFDY